MFKKIRVLRDIPGICPAGEYTFPVGVIDEKFAKVLVHKGLAEAIGGDNDANLSPAPNRANVRAGKLGRFQKASSPRRAR